MPIDDADPPARDVRLAPEALVTGDTAQRAIETGLGLPLAGDLRVAFTAVTLYRRLGDGSVRRDLKSLKNLRVHADETGTDPGPLLRALSARRDRFAGLPLHPGRPLVMGIVNVTPDSFSDGGEFACPDRAVRHGVDLLNAGADILDIGGESTRPGSDPVSPQAEIARVLPVVRSLAARGAAVSVDTRHGATMRAVLNAGARIINDITALSGDGEAADVIRTFQAPVIVMHMQGEPRTMQDAPVYKDAPLDIYDWLEERVAFCRTLGLSDEAICVDPGLGFGKTVAHNLSLLAEGRLLLGLGVPVLIAGSRKRFIGALTGIDRPRDRGPGSVAVALKAAREGAQIVRVHDVAETVQALKVAAALDRDAAED